LRMMAVLTNNPPTKARIAVIKSTRKE